MQWLLLMSQIIKKRDIGKKSLNLIRNWGRKLILCMKKITQAKISVLKM